MTACWVEIEKKNIGQNQLRDISMEPMQIPEN